MADGKRNNKHFTECLNSQIMTLLFYFIMCTSANTTFWKNPCLPLIVTLHDALTYLKSLSDHTDKCVLSMPNTYWDLWHQPIWTYTYLCTNCTRITYNCQVLSMYVHIVFINVWTYFMYPMCCWVVMSSLFTIKLKLLMKSALSLIFCMCIHNSKICLMHSTCKLIMSYWYLI